jgi:competence protein ComEA
MDRRRLLDYALPLLTLPALLIVVVRTGTSPGVEIELRDPPAGIDEIRVDVEGAVARPGVVLARPGERVGDVIAAAGGLVPDADAAALNLARRVVDAERLDVPRQGERRTVLIDLNGASAQELEALPGIGPVTAARIVAARGDGRFASSDDLVARGLVSARVYERLRDLVATP